jgi:hypothetical protein
MLQVSNLGNIINLVIKRLQNGTQGRWLYPAHLEKRR